MKLVLGAVLGAAALGSLSAPAFARCIPANQAYNRGYSVGQEACNWAQLAWANSAVVLGGRPGMEDHICDTSAVISCKAGFRDGFRSGRSQNIAGVTVPSCSRLLDSNYGDTFNIYAQTQSDLCNARTESEETNQ